MTKKALLFFMGFLSLSIAVSGNALAGKKASVKEKEGKVYYTAVNIWNEDGKEIFTTNYHRGQILPVNTKVTVESIGKKGIKFSDENSKSYTISIVAKHTPAPIDTILNNYFSTTPVNLGRFSGMERKNIEDGNIAVGMSKESVVVAYGYPPAHTTPDLTASQWKYWKDRFRNFFVVFNKDGKVSRMGEE